MKESEGKKKEAGTAKRFSPKKKLYYWRAHHSAWLGGFYSQPLIKKTKKNQKQKLLQGTNLEEKKCNKKVKNVEKQER